MHSQRLNNSSQGTTVQRTSPKPHLSDSLQGQRQVAKVCHVISLAIGCLVHERVGQRVRFDPLVLSVRTRATS